MKTSLVLAAALVAALGSEARAENYTPFGTIAGWTISAGDDSGFCTAESYRTDRRHLLFTLIKGTTEAMFRIGLSDPNWRLPVDSHYPVTVTILPQNKVFSGAAWATAADLVLIDIPISTVGEAFVLGTSMTITTERNSFSYTLEGSGAALRLLGACIDRNMAKTNPFGDAAPTAPSSAPSNNSF